MESAGENRRVQREPADGEAAEVGGRAVDDEQGCSSSIGVPSSVVLRVTR